MRYVVLLCLTAATSLAQPLTETQKLSSLGKVWGFLKYYHPAVASGQRDWDAQLIALLPAVRRAQDRQQLNVVYEQLIDGLGPVKPCRKCQSEPPATMLGGQQLDLSFLTDSLLFTGAVRSRLTYLKANRHQGDNHYVQLVKGIGNTSYENEKLYADMSLPDESYRLLTLFRYWNIIHYFFPYKYALDGNWNDVLTSLIPVFQRANNPEAYQKAIYQLVAGIQDSHGFLITMDKTRCMRCEMGTLWLPFELKLIDDKAIITRFYSDSIPIPPGLVVGTVISAIDGQSIRAHVDRIRPYVPASNEPDVLRDVRGLIGVSTDKLAQLTIEQNSHDTTVTASRYPYRSFGKAISKSINARYPVSKWLPNSIGYVNMGHLTSRQVDSIMKPLMQARAIIFDLRNYPQGTYWLIGRYLTDKRTPFARFTGPDMGFPGTFNQVGTSKLPNFNGKRYTGKVIVLVNEDTQSQAEFTAMAFRLVPNAMLVGSPTAGADGNISWVPLPGGYRTAFSGIGVYYPDGRETQRVGIVPDVLVRPSIEGIRAGQDEVLERAIDLTRGN